MRSVARRRLYNDDSSVEEAFGMYRRDADARPRSLYPAWHVNCNFVHAQKVKCEFNPSGDRDVDRCNDEEALSQTTASGSVSALFHVIA